VLVLKINFKNKNKNKNILIHFEAKNNLKSNHYYPFKHPKILYFSFENGLKYLFFILNYFLKCFILSF
jgi:hypothetical protein